MVSRLFLPRQVQVWVLFDSLQLELLHKLNPSWALTLHSNRSYQAICQWKKRGPASCCSLWYFQQRGPLPEPLNGCLALYSVQKQSSRPGQHSKQTTLHWTHSYFTSTVTPGEQAVGKRGREIGRDMDGRGLVCGCEYIFEMKDGTEADMWFNICICDRR